jgi:hypothetical protein
MCEGRIAPSIHKSVHLVYDRAGLGTIIHQHVARVPQKSTISHVQCALVLLLPSIRTTVIDSCSDAGPGQRVTNKRGAMEAHRDMEAMVSTHRQTIHCHARHTTQPHAATISINKLLHCVVNPSLHPSQNHKHTNVHRPQNI